jgi:metal-responsive CopG/Arc/MetJ family transcriptional regulator
MPRKKQHGGRRKGAGRKPSPEGKTVIVTASVPGELAEKLDALAARNGWSRSRAVTAAIRGLVANKRRT